MPNPLTCGRRFTGAIGGNRFPTWINPSCYLGELTFDGVKRAPRTENARILPFRQTHFPISQITRTKSQPAKRITRNIKYLRGWLKHFPKTSTTTNYLQPPQLTKSSSTERHRGKIWSRIFNFVKTSNTLVRMVIFAEYLQSRKGAWVIVSAPKFKLRNGAKKFEGIAGEDRIFFLVCSKCYNSAFSVFDCLRSGEISHICIRHRLVFRYGQMEMSEKLEGALRIERNQRIKTIVIHK